LGLGGIHLSAQNTISSPELHCIAVDSAGDVTLTWTLPPYIDASFQSYNVYSSNAYGGPYANSAIVTTSTQTSTTIKGLGANINPIYFYVLTDTTIGLANAIDTLESMFLQCNNIGGGIASLKWNAMHTPNLPSFNGWYKIYREYNYKWTLLDSTQKLTYNDTIHFCNLTPLHYQIVTNDASGCQSSSNWAGSSFIETMIPTTVFLDSVSVGPGGNISISWYPSNAANGAGYVVYVFNGAGWTAVDTVHGLNNTFYNYTGGSPGTGIVQIRVATLDSCKKVSPMDSTQNTIYLTQAPDYCSHTNTLNWNKFINFLPLGIGVGHYNIYCSALGAPTFSLIGSTSAGVTTFTHTNLDKAGMYCYFVQAVDSMDKTVTASSNIICYTVTYPPPPKFSYLNDATVNTSSTQNIVRWYSDSDAGVKEYIITRAPDPQGKFVTIGTVPEVSHVVNFSMVDPSADPNVQSYTYKVYSKDSCDYIIDSTNIGQTIFLTVTANSTDGTNSLSWNPYQSWQNNVDYYVVWRNEDDGPFTKVKNISWFQDTMTDNISQIITGQGKFGYYIQAIEVPSAYPMIDTSISNIAYAYQDPRVYIPNAFNPKGINKVFIPVGVFVDLQSYDFQMFDRWGQLIFETDNPTVGWDGTFHGKLVEEGVYVYHLVYTSNKGEFFNRKGSVLMLK